MRKTTKKEEAPDVLGIEYTERVTCPGCYQQILGIRSSEDWRDGYKMGAYGDHEIRCAACVMKMEDAEKKASDADEALRDFLSELICLVDRWPEGAPAADLAHVVGTWVEAMQRAQDEGQGEWPFLGAPKTFRQENCPGTMILSASFEVGHARALML
jgi:hypothetical protein